MEELLLSLLFAGDELHVVNQEQVRLAVLFPHFGGFVGTFLNGADQLVGQLIALDVGNAGIGIVAADDIGDGVDQMGLSKTGITVDQQGVIVLGGMVRNCLGSGVGQLVAGTDHKGIEGEFIRGKALALPLGI